MSEAPAALETHGLTKSFGAMTAVAGLEITVPRGSIAGFVGPNGSGKTTTMRMLLGLVRPTAGAASVLGEPITHPRRYLHRVGALIEGPAFYPTLSARTNLMSLARQGGHDRSRVPALLEQVGLADRAADQVRSYSLGMKQRLGIAAALLADPELLVLDEPANGLDPPGIIEMRDLLRRLRDAGKTLFVSSHLLAEVEQVADWLIVLKSGSSLYCGPAAGMPGHDDAELVVATEDPAHIAVVERIARDHGHPVSVVDGALRITAPPPFAAELNRAAHEAGVTIVELHRMHATLEESFLRMIDAREDDTAGGTDATSAVESTGSGAGDA